MWLTAEEKQQLREEMAAEPDAIWDKQEDYFISLIGIPQIDNRLLIWEIRLDFPLQYTYFKEFTTIFQEGFKCLLNSQLLKQIFALILATGNIMNGGIYIYIYINKELEEDKQMVLNWKVLLNFGLLKAKILKLH